MTKDLRPGSTRLDDATLEAVSGGGKGAALLFRDIGRIIGRLFRSGEKVVSTATRQIDRTDRKIDAIHDQVSQRAGTHTS